MKKIAFNLYSFGELSEAAKRKAVEEHQFDFLDTVCLDDVYRVISEIGCQYDRKQNSQCSFIELDLCNDSPLWVDFCGRKLLHWFYFKFMAGCDFVDDIYQRVYNDLQEEVEDVNGNAVSRRYLVRLFEKYIEWAIEAEEEYCCSDDYVADTLAANNYLFLENGQMFDKKGGVFIA